MSDKDILLVEDNPDDVELTRIAFAESGSAYRLIVVTDGAQAVDYLLARGAHAGRDPNECPCSWTSTCPSSTPRVAGVRNPAPDPAVVCDPSAEPTTGPCVTPRQQLHQKPVEFERSWKWCAVAVLLDINPPRRLRRPATGGHRRGNASRAGTGSSWWR